MPTSTPSTATKSFSQQELDQLLAPIALYPDPLFAQILMASTYPLDVVLAKRWVKANSSLKVQMRTNYRTTSMVTDSKFWN